MQSDGGDLSIPNALKMIAGKQNICYDHSGKNLHGTNDSLKYLKDKMDKLFLCI